MKKVVLGLTCVISLFSLPACDSSAIPVESTGCVWVPDSIYVQFYHAIFNAPDKDCNLYFEKIDFGTSGQIYGVYDFMQEMSGNPFINSCNLTWLSSIYTKKCDSYNLDANNDRVQLDLGNYTSALYPSDILEHAPIVRNDCNMIPEDYKHQLIIQIPGVVNTIDGSSGTLTWMNTWLGENDSQFFSSYNRWDFDCPIQGIDATYTPDLGFLREVYVYDQFIFIY